MPLSSPTPPAACDRLDFPTNLVPLLEGVEGARGWGALENRPPGALAGRKVVYLSLSPDVAEQYGSAASSQSQSVRHWLWFCSKEIAASLCSEPKTCTLYSCTRSTNDRLISVPRGHQKTLFGLQRVQWGRVSLLQQEGFTE